MVSQANQVAIVIVDNLVGNRQHVSSQPLLVSPNVSIALPFPCPSSFAHPPPSRFAACPSSPSWRPFSCVDPRGIICLSVAPSQLGSCDSTHLAAHRLANSSSQGALPISLPLVRPTIDPVLCQLAPRPTADQLVPRSSPHGEGLAHSTRQRAVVGRAPRHWARGVGRAGRPWDEEPAGTRQGQWSDELEGGRCGEHLGWRSSRAGGRPDGSSRS